MRNEHASGAAYFPAEHTNYHKTFQSRRRYSQVKAEAEPTATERTAAFNICGKPEVASVRSSSSRMRLLSYIDAKTEQQDAIVRSRAELDKAKAACEAALEPRIETIRTRRAPTFASLKSCGSNPAALQPSSSRQASAEAHPPSSNLTAWAMQTKNVSWTCTFGSDRKLVFFLSTL